MNAEPASGLEGLAIGELWRWQNGRPWLCHWMTGEITSISATHSDRSPTIDES